MEDAPLIARVVANDDRHAFATLVRRHQSAVRGFLLRLCCGDGALADDVAQETFLRAYQRIGTYRSEGDSIPGYFRSRTGRSHPKSADDTGARKI